MRRAIDLVVATLVVVVTAPLVATVAALILVRMGRPVLFRQRRVGRGGAPFTVVKFRTMRAPAWPAEPDEARISRLGAFLRASSLDELPQLCNVLRGEMSLIGPRPTLPEQVAHYTSRQRGRLAIRPGLTGWAQVNGRNSISWPDRIELDLWYIAHRRPSLDLKILGRTAARLVRPTGVTGQGGVNPDFPDPAAAGPTPPPSGAEIHQQLVPPAPVTVWRCTFEAPAGHLSIVGQPLIGQPLIGQHSIGEKLA